MGQWQPPAGSRVPYRIVFEMGKDPREALCTKLRNAKLGLDQGWALGHKKIHIYTFLFSSKTFLFSVCRSASKERREQSERTKWAVVMSEFAPICIYLVISPLVSLIPLGVPFPFASNSSTYPEKLSAHECGSDPSGDARSRFDIRFYLVSILFIIPDPEVTFSFPWAVPPNKIDPFGSWSMMAFLLILTIGSLYEWKRGASDRE